MQMKDDAQNQMVNITIEDIQAIVKRLHPDKYEKMMIDGSSQVIVSNYFYVKYSGISANRQVKKIIFPLFPDAENLFKDFEGGEAVHGSKKKMENGQLLKTLELYKIAPENTDIITQMTDVFEFPIDIENGVINKSQHNYFIPKYTISFDCPQCKGAKYITCINPDCLGKHEWDCPACKGTRKINCTVCSASGYVKCTVCKGRGQEQCTSCAGTSEVKCSHCGGDGYVGKKKDDDSNKCTFCEGKGWHVCPECSGGLVKCDICSGKGEVKCKTCKASGKVDCLSCKATGKILCDKCYGDQPRYGKIDCPNCKTMGRMGQLMYVETPVTEHNIDKVFCKNARLNIITDEHILKYANRNGKTEAMLVNINEQKLEAYDDFSGDFVKSVKKELGLEMTKFPKILKEEVFYQLIPCVRTSYKHVLTNTIHEFTVMNFFNSPDIIFHSEPEELKGGLGSAAKSTGNFFGKVFQTKAHQEKEDKKREIRLMIYIAKADGVVLDVEKEIISTKIGNLEDFTNSEKKKLFDLINIKSVPELKKDDVDFSEHANKDQIIKDLINLALADGKMDASEKLLIDKIKQMMQ
jgi:uncharacterized tellurite resistance protein B-like protein